MIIGVAGRNGAGKGELVQFLEARSFTAHSLSDVIRQELALRGLPETRERMIEVGQELRRRSGPGALAQKLVKQLRPDRNYAIDSIRHPVEVEILRHCGQTFHLVWVDAKLETRFERMRLRGRSGDPKTVAELERLESLERGSDDPNAQQLDAVEAEADYRIANDDTLEAFQKQIELWVAVEPRLRSAGLGRLLHGHRPGRGVAQQLREAQGRGGRDTIDRRIISTGYNGTPRGTPQLQRGRLPALQQPGARRDASRRMPLLPRRGERDHAGGLPRRLAQGQRRSTRPSRPACSAPR